MPDLPYHLVDVRQYLPLYQNQRSFYFQASRGCPFSCSVCYNSVFNQNRLRKLSADIVLERLKNAVNNFQIKNVYFVDDNFFIDLDWCREIIKGLKKLNISWQVQGVDISSLKRMDDKFIDLLAESRCVRITLGVESGSPRIRSLLGKSVSVEDIIEQIARFNRLNIIVYCSFMAGIPTETAKDLKMTIDLILKLIKDFPFFSNSPIYNFTPWPGTKLFDLSVEKGFIMPLKLQDWSRIGGWDQPSNLPSLEKKIPKASTLYFLSNFLDRKTNEYPVPALLKLLIRLYRPFAYFRLRHNIFSFMIEEYFAQMIRNIWIGLKDLNPWRKIQK